MNHNIFLPLNFKLSDLFYYLLLVAFGNILKVIKVSDLFIPLLPLESAGAGVFIFTLTLYRGQTL
jgi:hypothetical protein